MIVVNDDAVHGRRTDQTDLKLLNVYYFFLRKIVSLTSKTFSLNPETTNFFFN